MTTQRTLTPDELLAGADATYTVAVPQQVLRPGQNGHGKLREAEAPGTVELRPLTIGTFQLIMKAARDDTGLIPLLMIKEALVNPALSMVQIRTLHLGLIEFLIGHIRQISGLTEKKTP